MYRSVTSFERDLRFNEFRVSLNFYRHNEVMGEGRGLCNTSGDTNDPCVYESRMGVDLLVWTPTSECSGTTRKKGSMSTDVGVWCTGERVSSWCRAWSCVSGDLWAEQRSRRDCWLSGKCRNSRLQTTNFCWKFSKSERRRYSGDLL